MKKILSLMLLLAATLMAAAQFEMPPIPKDADVKIGKLENGLTYYIRHNNWPEDRVNFYIAQRVGSLQEEENQRGLAHFLEHMCFNGSDHFEGNGIVSFCERQGVNFGGDLNAYTSIAETVYRVCNVPSTLPEASLDSCMYILYDWANGLTLDPAEIDKERGVVHEEWRLRTSGQDRIINRQLPKLYPGSKYGERMPIGLMSVIDNHTPAELRAYYEKWYNPENQCLVIVGNIDVDKYEQKIKDLFSGIKAPENAGKVEPVAVPDNEETIFSIDRDKEMQQNIVGIMFKHEAIKPEEKLNMDYLIVDYVQDAIRYMTNQRLADMALKADCPFLGAEGAEGDFFFSDTKGAFTIEGVIKEGKEAEALKTFYIEARRIAEFGFTATEFERFKQEYMSNLDNALANKDKRNSHSLAMQYYNNYLHNNPMPGIDEYTMIMKSLIPQIPVEAVNEMAKQFIQPSDKNAVVMCWNVEKEGNTYPTEETLKAAIEAAKAEQIEAFVDNVKNEPIMTTLPKAGKITKETKNDVLGYTELQLSNGAKVILKKTDFKADQVLTSAAGDGGYNKYGKADRVNVNLFDEIPVSTGNFTTNELEKALAGKRVSIGTSLSQTRFNISGSCAPQDIETQLQLIYLNFTATGKDDEAFQNYMTQAKVALENKVTVPEQALSDSLQVTITSHDPMHAPLYVEDLAEVNYDRIVEIARDQMSNAAAFTFYFIGNYDEETIRPLICQYIASLPGNAKKVKKSAYKNTFPTKDTTCKFERKMDTPKAFNYTFWSNSTMPWTLDNRVKNDLAGQVLAMIYTKKIREDAGAAYSPQALGRDKRYDEKNYAYQLIGVCPMNPDLSDTAISIMRAETPGLGNECDAEMLQKAKDYTVKAFDQNIKSNSYWLSTISEYVRYGVDTYSTYRQIVEAQTPETIKAYINEYNKNSVRVETIMLPEK